MSTGGYPLGAKDDPRAPYNQPDPIKVKAKVCVSICYAKLIEVEVDENYDELDLREAARIALHKDLDSMEQKGYDEYEFDVEEY